MNLDLAMLAALLVFHDSPSRVQAVDILDIIPSITKSIPASSYLSFP
jgi:hypothetical protein